MGMYSDEWEYLGVQEKNAVRRLIDDGNVWVWDGKLYEDFCAKVSRMSGNRYVLPVCNGTMALIIAGFSLNLAVGDEVIIGTYGYMASVSPILATGATPVFCDVDRETLTITPEAISRRITKRTKAIIVAHSWGNPADMTRIYDLANEVGVSVLSDSSHAHGAVVRNKQLGCWADISCYSMGFGKLVTGGELGVITTDNLNIYERAVAISGVKLTNSLSRITVKDAVPFKARPHGLSIAIANESIDRLKEKNILYSQFANDIYSGIYGLDWISPQKQVPNTSRVYYRIPLILSDALSIDVINTIKEKLRLSDLPYIDEEYGTPLNMWNNIKGINFTSSDRFKYSKMTKEGDIPCEYIGNRVLHFWPYAQPKPESLASDVASELQSISQEIIKYV